MTSRRPALAGGDEDADEIVLAPSDPVWALRAEAEGRRLAAAFGEDLVAVEHIGSTAIPGIVAKPILDLLPVVRTLAAADRAREAVEALGYRWQGEYGIPGRRFCTLDDRGRRIVHAHVFAEGDPQVARHLAFRDYLRAHPDESRAYEQEKLRARARHPHDRAAYADDKGPWIRACDERAARWRARRDI